mmetsp:Transcript_68314/g.127501  ORF Transcript_68314/g.127501 Transcript_68314/m.127501 type:complete len:82 (-) Transcript_68314:1072-1317(-)
MPPASDGTNDTDLQRARARTATQRPLGVAVQLKPTQTCALQTLLAETCTPAREASKKKKHVLLAQIALDVFLKTLPTLAFQ